MATLLALHSTVQDHPFTAGTFAFDSASKTFIDPSNHGSGTMAVVVMVGV